MKTTKRFDEAVNKLYKAFNEGTLDAFNCNACAVGNLVGNGYWAMHSIKSVSEIYALSCNWNPPSHKDYSAEELFNVEKIFLTEWEKASKLDELYAQDKNIQFEGLMAVIEYLAELDGTEVPKIAVEQFESVLERESV